MDTRRFAAKSLMVWIVMVSLAASPARSDNSVAIRAEAKKLCYCECDHGQASAMCHHLCELPKYQNRSWAKSCHPARSSEINQTSPAQPAPKPTNRTERARLN